MKRLNDDRMRFVLVGFVAAMVLGGGSVRADFTFGEPINLGATVNSPFTEFAPRLSPDNLSLYFTSNRSDGFGKGDIWVSTRQTSERNPEGYWGEPVNLGPIINTEHGEWCPSISSDGLTLFFCSNRPGGFGNQDIWVTKRETKDDDWGSPMNLGLPVNSSSDERGVSIADNALELYFSSGKNPERTRPGGYGLSDIWVSTRPSKNDPWGEPVNLGPVVNSSNYEAKPCISPDGLLLFFDSVRPGGYGTGDLYMTRRATLSDPWETPVNLGPIINSPDYEEYPSISFDGKILLFDNYTKEDIYQASITPIVDLNSDGIVDSADMVIMIDNWGTNNSLCDIGPMPWGDGIVDVEDLIVLAEHLFEEFP